MTAPASLPNDSRSAKDARRRRFVDEYIVDHNGVRAYFAAFGRTTQQGRERSRNAAAVEASKLLKKPAVRDEIRAAQKNQRQRTRVTADRVIREIAAIAFSDIGDFFDLTCEGHSQLLNVRDMPFISRKALKKIKMKKRRQRPGDSDEISIEEVESFEVTLHSKLRALDMLGKHLGLFSKTNALDDFLNCLSGPLREQVISAIHDATKNPRGAANRTADPEIRIINGDEDGREP